MFGPESTAWYVARERILLAGGTSALLLQIAHPLVAEGVAKHSTFDADQLRRLRHTLDATLSVTFGDIPQACAAADAVRARHQMVRGVLPAATGRLPAGTPYSAQDPDLALWVFATLVMTALDTREGFVGTLPPAARERYYQEMKAFGRLFGVTDQVLPHDYQQLKRYFEAMVTSSLVVGGTARRLAARILAPGSEVIPRALQWVPPVVAAGLLPDCIREQYGLPWRRRERLLHASLRAAVRWLLPVVPGRLRYWPHYGVALDRVSSARDNHVSRRFERAADRR